MEKLSKQKLLFSFVLSAALIALIVLAGLQYYWIGQISEGELARSQANLETGMQRFSEDFDREFARMYLSFQMDSETLRTRNWPAYTQRYRYWNATAPHPNLVKNVYLIEVFRSGRTRLLQFNSNEGRFFSVYWPEELRPIRQELAELGTATLIENELGNVVEPIVEDIPALIIPPSRSWLLTDPQEGDLAADQVYGDAFVFSEYGECWQCQPESRFVPSVGYTMVTINDTYLTSTFIPELNQQHFTSDNQLDYHVAIVNRNNHKDVIYQSHPDMTITNAATADRTTPLLSVRVNELNRLFIDMTSGKVQPPDQPSQDRLFLQVVPRESLDSEATNAIAIKDSRGRWQLMLQHRYGSLEAAKANLQNRHFLISFGTLLLLAASIAMIVISTRQAQHLARQQMEFAASVSHELRTPLAVICAAGENLADGVIDNPQKAQQYGKIIINEGRRLSEMVEQALAFTSTQSERHQYNRRPVDISRLIEETVAEYRLLSPHTTIEAHIQPDLPYVLADAAALQRAIQNLLNNATKYSSAHHYIHIYTQLVANDHSHEIHITVADNGQGIEATDLPYIFEPFYRGQNAVQNQVKGSGLGLSLVKHTIDAIGGRLYVKSDVGSGSSFTMQLPIIVSQSQTVLIETPPSALQTDKII